MAGVGKLMKQMAKVQKKMTALQEEMAKEELTVSSGGGAVNVTVTLQSEVKAIKLDPEFLKEEASLVEETILTAVQDALKQASEKNEAAVQAITADLQLPGGFPGM